MRDPRTQVQPVPKRSRHEASPSSGAVLFLTLVLASVFFSWLSLEQMRHDYRVFFVYQKASATIRDKRLITYPAKSSDDVDTYRVEFEFEYTVDGKTHIKRGYDDSTGFTGGRSGYEMILAYYEIGKSYPCWYDPDHPNQAVLHRSLTYWYLLVPIPFLFQLMLVYGIWDWFRRKVIGTAAGKRSVQTSQIVPAVLLAPGRTLPHALRQSEPGNGCLIACGLFAVFWIWWLIQAILLLPPFSLKHGHFGGGDAFEWLLICGLGYACFRFLLKELTFRSKFGRMELEIGSPALYPGESFEVLLQLAYRTHPKYVQMNLLCEEHATYREGTADTTAAERVFCGALYDSQQNAQALSNTHRVRVRFPAWGMHNLWTSHNRITWQLEVLIKYDGCDLERRTYDLPVYATPSATHG